MGHGNGLFLVRNLETFQRGTSTSKRNLQVDESIEKLLGFLMTMIPQEWGKLPAPPPPSTCTPCWDIDPLHM